MARRLTLYLSDVTEHALDELARTRITAEVPSNPGAIIGEALISLVAREAAAKIAPHEREARCLDLLKQMREVSDSLGEAVKS